MSSGAINYMVVIPANANDSREPCELTHQTQGLFNPVGRHETWGLGKLSSAATMHADGARAHDRCATCCAITAPDASTDQAGHGRRARACAARGAWTPMARMIHLVCNSTMIAWAIWVSEDADWTRWAQQRAAIGLRGWNGTAGTARRTAAFRPDWRATIGARVERRQAEGRRRSQT